MRKYTYDVMVVHLKHLKYMYTGCVNKTLGGAVSVALRRPMCVCV